MKRLPEYLLILYALTATISIAISQIVMGCGALVAVVDRGRNTVLRFARTGLEAPLVAWVAACLVASVFASDPLASFVKSKKVLLLALVYWAPAVITRMWSFGRLFLALLFSAGVTSLYGMTMFLVHGGPIGGFHGFHLTNHGLLLLCTFPAVLFALSPTISASYRIGAAIAALSILAVQLFGRIPSAWIGTGVGLVYLGIRRRSWPLAMLAPAAAGLLLLVPGLLHHALVDLVDPLSEANRFRLRDAAVGAALFRSDPFTGLGLHDLTREYASVVGAPSGGPGHVRSVPVQIAASMGVPGILAFVWLMGSFFRALTEARRRVRGEPLLRLVVDGTEAGLVAFLAAGLVGWNFGDSEQLALLAFLIGAAIAAGRCAPEAPAAT